MQLPVKITRELNKSSSRERYNGAVYTILDGCTRRLVFNNNSGQSPSGEGILTNQYDCTLYLLTSDSEVKVNDVVTFDMAGTCREGKVKKIVPKSRVIFGADREALIILN